MLNGKSNEINLNGTKIKLNEPKNNKIKKIIK